MKDEILQAAAALEKAEAALSKTRFTIGFDGFVDEILHAVETRRSIDDYDRVSTIADFSARVSSAAGKSANIELVPIQIKMGGNGPLMSMAVANLGSRVTCIGLLGYPKVLPVFDPLASKAEVISLGNPGHTDALEFQDGKLMLGKLQTLRDVSWKRIEGVMGAERFRALILASDMVVCTNWTMLTEMGDVFDRLAVLLPTGSKVKLFFDLTDPEKRPRQDLEQVLRQIRALNAKAPCILGLNLREAEQVSDALGLRDMPQENAASVEAAAVRIAQTMGIFGVVVHALRCAGAWIDGVSAGVDGPYCPNPKLSTGAGDHFNGGFTSGLMAGLAPRDALYCGVGTSGWYVRNARSPERADVAALLRDWAQGKPLD